MFDILIHNGKIIDGSGSPAFKGDVGINSGRISAIGDLSAAKSKETIANPNVYPDGLGHVIVNGVTAFSRGNRTPDHAGMVLRRN